MTPQTPSQRKALERQRKRERGLSPMEVWARPEDHQRIKAYVLKLNRKTA